MSFIPRFYLSVDDINYLADAFTFPWLTRKEAIAKWTRYYHNSLNAICDVCIVEKIDGARVLPVGYGTLLHKSGYHYFKELEIPEIHDVWVSSEVRKQGIGTLIVKGLEGCAQKAGYKQVGIGVGVYSDYGNAQRLYVKLGYVPDGRGMTYDYEQVVPGKIYQVNDELVFWLLKHLS